MHTLILELPDEIYVPLLDKAQRSASTPEAFLTQLAAQAVQPVRADPLLSLLGSVASEMSDVSGKHDDYIGRSLQSEAGQ